MKGRIVLLFAVVVLSLCLSGFTGCAALGKLTGTTPAQDIAGTCVSIKLGEDAVLLLAANHQLNMAWLPRVKEVVLKSQVVCNKDPQPTTLSAEDFASLLSLKSAMAQAQVPGSTPSP